MADSVTQMRVAGPAGTKRNIAVLGDGFAAADQTTYNNKVRRSCSMVCSATTTSTRTRQAFNIFRVNLISIDSGVSHARLRRARARRPTAATTPSRQHDAQEHRARLHLQRLVGALLARVRREHGDARAERAQHLGAGLRPRARSSSTTPGFGGCGGGGFQIVTLGVELGRHGARVRPRHRRAAPTSTASAGTYTGGEPGAVNLTTNTNRATTQMGQFRRTRRRRSRPARGTCTGLHRRAPKPAGWSNDQDVGLFEGGGTLATGHLPSGRSTAGCAATRRRICPVCYTELKTPARSSARSTVSSTCYAGDFNGDGKDDLLVHNGNSIHALPLERLAARSRVQRASSGCPAPGSSSRAISSSSATSTATARTKSSSSTAPTGRWSIWACSPTTATTA